MIRLSVIGNVYDIKSLKANISNILIAIIIVSLCLFGITFLATYFLYKKNSDLMVENLIRNDNKILLSNIGEQIYIIANNQDFIRYINYGEESRRINNSRIELLFSNIDRRLIPSISVYNDSDIIFSTGAKTDISASVVLCYLGGKLDFTYGMCKFKIKMYFNKNAYIDALRNIDIGIRNCSSNECIKISPFKNNKIGQFNVIDASKGSISILYERAFPHILISTTILFVLLTLILTLIGVSLIRKLVELHLTNPIKEIEFLIKSNKKQFKKRYINELNYLLNVILNNKDEAITDALSKKSVQVAHDIRSPVSVLNGCVKSLSSVDAKQRDLIESSVIRINEIADNLLNDFRGVKSNRKNAFLITSIPEIIRSVASEKRAEFKGRHLKIDEIMTSDGKSSFSTIEASELKRILSNIINNAEESISSENGEICLHVDAENNTVIIKISDNGSGVPLDIIDKIFERGFSLKNNGTGLGLSHAKEVIEIHGGAIQLSSNNCGTTVELRLPRVMRPQYQEGAANKLYDAVLLDDNVEVTEMWEMRALLSGKDVLVFSDLLKFEDSLSHISKDTPIYIDSDLSEYMKGENYAEILYNAGYHELHLATGHANEKFNNIPWIKSISDKHPPF